MRGNAKALLHPETSAGARVRRILWCLGAIAALLPSVGTLANAQTLTAYWAANDDFFDGSGNGRTLTNHGSTFVAGKYGRAFSLNGVDQYLSLQPPNYSVMASNFTISTWVNFETISNRDQYAGGNSLVAHDTAAFSYDKWNLYYDGSKSKIGFLTQTPSAATWAESATVVAAAHEWCMFTVTGDISSHVVSFYFNGQAKGTFADMLTPSPNTGTVPLTIGELESIGWTNGAFDDIRIYNGAMSAAQVQSLYDGSDTPVETPEPSSALLLGIVALGGAAYGVRRRKQGSKTTA